MRRVVVSIYVDPDFFPPTINAILNLAEEATEVVVICRNNAVKDYPYPSNVRLIKIGGQMPVRTMEKQPAWLKLFYFSRFSLALRKQAKKTDTDVLLLYDPIALFAWYLVRRFCPKKKVWYHNHDMPDKTGLRKYSIGGLAARFENKAMRDIDFFSLPSEERLGYYPELKKEIGVFISPNYPSLKVYPQRGERPIGETINIIYQGFIGKGHALEEFIELLQEDINGYTLNLILKGSVSPEYKAALNAMAGQYEVSDKVFWREIGPYYEIPELTASCDIGIGINMNKDAVSQTQGTASNKIYEYAASGLPVILYESQQFTSYLGKYNWAFFSDGTIESIKENVALILNDLPLLKRSARIGFEESLNFEKRFLPALRKI